MSYYTPKCDSPKAAFYADTTRKPAVLTPVFDGIPPELRDRPRWVLWRLTLRADRGAKQKWAKTPHRPNGRAAKSNVPSTWTSFGDVAAAHTGGGFEGVGLALGDGLAGVDLDNCRNPGTGELAPWAAAIVTRFGTYCEASPSGTGVKLIGRGAWHGPGNRFRVGGNEIEVYDSGRYFTVTGRVVGGASRVADIQHSLDSLTSPAPSAPEADAPPPSSGVGFAGTDEELLTVATRKKNGKKFAALWEGDCSGHDGDASRADLALCSILAFWCGPDRERIDRLFRSSGLMRAKWDELRSARGDTYGALTINTVLADKAEFFTPRSGASRKPHEPAAPSSNSAIGAVLYFTRPGVRHLQTPES